VLANRRVDGGPDELDAEPDAAASGVEVDEAVEEHRLRRRLQLGYGSAVLWRDYDLP
jgi:hypothetical protein